MNRLARWARRRPGAAAALLFLGLSGLFFAEALWLLPAGRWGTT